MVDNVVEGEPGSVSTQRGASWQGEQRASSVSFVIGRLVVGITLTGIGREDGTLTLV